MKKQYRTNELIVIVFKNIIVIGVFAVIGGICAGLYAKHKQTTIYTSATSIFIGHNLDQTNYKNSQVMADLNMVDSYKDIINDFQVMEEAHSRLPKKLRHMYTVSDLRDAINVDSHPQSLVLTIKSQADTPKAATEIVNATATAARKEIPKSIPNAGEIRLLGKAKKDNVGSITTPSIKKYIILGTSIGLLIGMLISFAVTTWKKIF